MKPYHNKGFGVAFMWIIGLLVVFPAVMILSIDDGFAKFVQMRGVTGDCWENSKLKELTLKIPEFCLSHWLLRIPLIIVFLQQGLQKIPVTVEGAESFDLPYIVWWFAAWGEVGAGIGLLIGGLMMYS